MAVVVTICRDSCDIWQVAWCLEQNMDLQTGRQLDQQDPTQANLALMGFVVH